MAENNVKIVVSAEDKASEKLKGIGASFSSLAKLASGAIGLLGVTEGIKASISAMNDQVRVNTQLESVLKSTKGAVGLSSQAIQDMASNLQSLTTFSDDTIQTGQNMLLTFTNIGKEVFPQATATLLDMATAMNNGATPSAEALSAQAIQLGKALNDPVQGISALSRVGVTFTEGQKNVIEAFVKGGETAKAQQIILNELNREFGGSAQAQAQTFAGKMQQIGNSIGDIAEIVGFAVLPALTLMANKLKVLALEGVQFFNENSEVIMRFANDIYVFFESILGTIIGAIKSVYQSISSIFTQIFGDSQETAIGIGDAFSFALKAMAMGFESVALVANIVIKSIVFGVKWLLNTIRGGVTGIVGFFGTIMTGWMLLIEGVVNTVIGGVNFVMEALGKSTYELASFGRDAFASFTSEISSQNEDVTQAMQDNWESLGEGISKDISNAVSNMSNTMSGFDKNIKATSINLNGLALDGKMGMNGIADATGNATKKTKEHNEELKKLVENAQKIITDITAKVNESKKAVEDATDAVKKKTSEWMKYKQEGVKALSDVNNEIRKLKAEAGDIQVKFKNQLDDKLAERYLEIQKELGQEGADVNALTKERELIEMGVNKAVLETASSYEKLSQSEKIILDIQKEKNKEVEENKKKIESLIEKQTLLQMQADQKSIRDLKINTDLKDGMITASYETEKGKRAEIHDYENIQLALQIADKQKAFSDEMSTLEQNLQIKLSKEKSVLEELKVAYATHNAYLKSDTKATAESMMVYLSGVAQSLRDVIALRKEAGMASTPTPTTVVGARAVGGDVSANKPYKVGENGEEIFVPNGAGHIIPNNKIGGSNNISVNISGVTITSGIDLDTFSNRIQKEVARAFELAKLGIS